jgi:hypothetical protein
MRKPQTGRNKDGGVQGSSQHTRQTGLGYESRPERHRWRHAHSRNPCHRHQLANPNMRTQGTQKVSKNEITITDSCCCCGRGRPHIARIRLHDPVIIGLCMVNPPISKNENVDKTEKQKQPTILDIG